MVAVLQRQTSLRDVKSSCIGRSSNLPMRWRCAACVPCPESGRCRLIISMLSVSLLGSWSFQTRIPQRTHAQLYGTMYGILESTHQVWVPPAQWAELEVPFEAAARGGAVILADDRDANKATCVYSCISRRKCCKRNIPGHTGLGFMKATYAHFFSQNIFWVLLTGHRCWRHSSCSPVPGCQIQVFPGLWGSSVLQSWTFFF